jgi:UrcA family protein
MKTLTLAAAALGLACTTAPAFAGEAERLSARIELSDINLATVAGQKKLDNRIERAARTVCRVLDVDSGKRMINQEARDCVVKVRADARQQVAAITGDRQRGG